MQFTECPLEAGWRSNKNHQYTNLNSSFFMNKNCTAGDFSFFPINQHLRYFRTLPLQNFNWMWLFQYGSIWDKKTLKLTDDITETMSMYCTVCGCNRLNVDDLTFKFNVLICHMKNILRIHFTSRVGDKSHQTLFITLFFDPPLLFFNFTENNYFWPKKKKEKKRFFGGACLWRPILLPSLWFPLSFLMITTLSSY